MENSKYLIAVSVGPVQDFIASARRSRDLWFGSWLLSEISKTVAEAVGKQNLIFPTDLTGNVVNKILAVIEKPDDSFDGMLKTAIGNRLGEICDPIFDKIQKSVGKVFFREKAETQIKDMPELYWAAVPFDDGNYRICRAKVEAVLSARKSTRNFNKVTWGSDAPKSSLDGLRESVIEDSQINNVQVQRAFNLRRAERLCGVGVLKRLAEKSLDRRFASTSHMASLPLLKTLANTPENIERVRTYAAALTDLIFEIEDKDLGSIPKHLNHPVFGQYDGHLLFKTRLSDLPFDSPENKDNAKLKLDSFMNDAFGDKNIRPSPYYALLQADGDRMGRVIDHQANAEDHKELSGALSGFANNVDSIVTQHQGCLIYAGGDDVLALLPLHTVLGCARALAEDYKTKLSADERFVDSEGNPSTLSVGIAIYHHTQPLQDALMTMRNAEKEAKSVKGKNALAIILSKRSGSDTTIKGSWGNDGQTEKSFDERLKWFIYLHLAEALPSGVAFELRDLWLRFRDESSSKGDVLPGFEKIVKAEAYRIIKRKKAEGGKKEISNEVLTDLRRFIDKSQISIEHLAKEIIVAKELAKAYKQSGMSAKEFALENMLYGGEDEQ